MITDEQIDELLQHMPALIINDFTETYKRMREHTREWLEPILAAERNRLLDECLKTIRFETEKAWGLSARKDWQDDPREAIKSFGTYLERRIEALRHE